MVKFAFAKRFPALIVNRERDATWNHLANRSRDEAQKQAGVAGQICTNNRHASVLCSGRGPPYFLPQCNWRTFAAGHRPPSHAHSKVGSSGFWRPPKPKTIATIDSTQSYTPNAQHEDQSFLRARKKIGKIEKLSTKNDFPLSVVFLLLLLFICSVLSQHQDG